MFRKGSFPYQYIPYDPSSKLVVRLALNGQASCLSPIREMIFIVLFSCKWLWGAWVIWKARSINSREKNSRVQSLTNNVNQWKLIMITLTCIKKVEKVLTPVGSAFTKERMSCLKSIKKGLTCKKKILILCACLFLCLFFSFSKTLVGRKMGSETLHWHGVLIWYLTCPTQLRCTAKI